MGKEAPEQPKENGDNRQKIIDTSINTQAGLGDEIMASAALSAIIGTNYDNGFLETLGKSVVKVGVSFVDDAAVLLAPYARNLLPKTAGAQITLLSGIQARLASFARMAMKPILAVGAGVAGGMVTQDIQSYFKSKEIQKQLKKGFNTLTQEEKEGLRVLILSYEIHKGRGLFQETGDGGMYKLKGVTFGDGNLKSGPLERQNMRETGQLKKCVDKANAILERLGFEQFPEIKVGG